MNFNEKTRISNARCALFGIIAIVLGSAYAVNVQLVPLAIAAPAPAARQSSSSGDVPIVAAPTRNTGGVYKTISDILERERNQRNSRRSSENTRTDRQTEKKPVTPVTVEVKKPVVKDTKPVAPTTPKKTLMYQTLQTFIPSDPYIENGFNPITSNILYGLSGVIAAAGVLLLFGKPAFLARRLVSLFTFA